MDGGRKGFRVIRLDLMGSGSEFVVAGCGWGSMDGIWVDIGVWSAN